MSAEVTAGPPRDPEAGALVLGLGGFAAMIEALLDRGYEVIAPTERGGAIEPAPDRAARELPIGLGETQDGGTYRLRRRDDDALFGFANGPGSWKRLLHPPTFGSGARAPTSDGGWRDRAGARRAAADGLHRRPLVRPARDPLARHRPARDRAPRPRLRAAPRGAFIVAVNCGVAGGTCFCASTGTGPRRRCGYDLALTEMLDGDGHRFLVEVGSERGAELLAELPVVGGRRRRTSARPRAIVERTEREHGPGARRQRACKDLLYRNLEHPRWDEVSERCLTCGNCTMVCPTCFCTDVEDVTDLVGVAERRQRWDSCFTIGFHLRPRRQRPLLGRSRYRQWMTHKLASWSDQFDSAGCVGCGRCITWCPVAIDITEEAAAIRATDGATAMRDDRGAPCGDPGARRAAAGAERDSIAGCGRNVVFDAGRGPLPRGRPRRRLLRDPQRLGRARDGRAPRAPADRRDAARRRRARLVVAVSALPGPVRRPR